MGGSPLLSSTSRSTAVLRGSRVYLPCTKLHTHAMVCWPRSRFCLGPPSAAMDRRVMHCCEHHRAMLHCDCCRRLHTASVLCAAVWPVSLLAQ